MKLSWQLVALIFILSGLVLALVALGQPNVAYCVVIGSMSVAVVSLILG